MLQNHNSIGQNNTEQNKRRQNNIWIGDSHSKTRQHHPFCSHHKSVFPTQKTPTGTPTYTPQQDSSMHHTLQGRSTLSKADPHPPFLPPSSFSQSTTSHALGKQPSAEPFQKNSMKSKLFGTPPPHKHPNRHPPKHMPQTGPSMHHTLQGRSTPTLLATVLLFPRHHFPCSWQTTISRAISEGLSESQAHWQAKKFRDHWQEKSGKEALKVDWQAP